MLSEDSVIMTALLVYLEDESLEDILPQFDIGPR